MYFHITNNKVKETTHINMCPKLHDEYIRHQWLKDEANMQQLKFSKFSLLRTCSETLRNLLLHTIWHGVTNGMSIPKLH